MSANISAICLGMPADRIKALHAQVMLDFACVVACGLRADAQPDEQLCQELVALVHALGYFLPAESKVIYPLSRRRFVA